MLLLNDRGKLFNLAVCFFYFNDSVTAVKCSVFAGRIVCEHICTPKYVVYFKYNPNSNPINTKYCYVLAEIDRNLSERTSLYDSDVISQLNKYSYFENGVGTF